MIILDDHLTLLVLAGGIQRDQFPDRVLTVSLWYLRLVAAVTAPSVSERGPGRLIRLLDTLRPSDREAALARILEPPAGLVEVLHPMRFAVQMARVQRERHLNLLAAETIGAAVHHGASIVVAAPNGGGPIEQAALAEGVSYSVRTSQLPPPQGVRCKGSGMGSSHDSSTAGIPPLTWASTPRPVGAGTGR